jgi:hypothetical protein
MRRRFQHRVPFPCIRDASLRHLNVIVKRWLPEGRKVGSEWVVRNPMRADTRPGSFKINLRTGLWADFATGDKGGDVISLAAYLFRLSQVEAARKVASMLALSIEGER